jgi:DNA-binding transcriptional regulator YiaG
MGRFEMSETFYLNSEEVRNEPVLYRACGLDEIYLLNGYDLEDHDGDNHMSVTKIDELHQAIGRHLVTHRKGLSPKEIRFLRNTMNLTQAELAARLGNDSQSVARWEKGQCEVPGASEKLLRVVYLAHLLTDEEMAALRDFLNNSLNALDEIDETETVQGRFQLGDKWFETPCEDRALAYA